jgi:hypothetical protein
VGGLLQIDPDERLSPFAALQHPFLATLVNVPLSLFNVDALYSSQYQKQLLENHKSNKRRGLATLTLNKLRKKLKSK